MKTKANYSTALLLPLLIALPVSVSLAQEPRDIVVAIIDTGMDVNHPLLKKHLWVNPHETSLDTDNDGMPDAWETKKGLNPNDANDRNKVDASGYTMLEIYLNELVQMK